MEANARIIAHAPRPRRPRPDAGQQLRKAGDHARPAFGRDGLRAEVDVEQRPAEGRRLDGGPRPTSHRRLEASAGTAGEDDLGVPGHLVEVEVAAELLQRRLAPRHLHVGGRPAHSGPQGVVERIGHVLPAHIARQDDPERQGEVAVEESLVEARVAREARCRLARERGEGRSGFVRLHVQTERVDLHPEPRLHPQRRARQPVGHGSAGWREEDGEHDAAPRLPDRFRSRRLAGRRSRHGGKHPEANRRSQHLPAPVTDDRRAPGRRATAFLGAA